VRIRETLIFLLLPSLAACAASQRSVADPLIGCYTLELGSWDPPLRPGNAIYQIPPSTFHLTGEVGAGRFGNGRFLVRPLIPHGQTPSAFWEAVGPDSVRVTWTNGFAGVSLRLQRKGEDLEGRATSVTDVLSGAPPPETDVEARRRECNNSAPA
jgi:hypothetical protein